MIDCTKCLCLLNMNAARQQLWSSRQIVLHQACGGIRFACPCSRYMTTKLCAISSVLTAQRVTFPWMNWLMKAGLFKKRQSWPSSGKLDSRWQLPGAGLKFFSRRVSLTAVRLYFTRTATWHSSIWSWSTKHVMGEYHALPILKTLLLHLGWNKLQISREILGTGVAEGWKLTIGGQLEHICHSLFAHPANTKHDLEDCFAHLASVAKLSTMATPLGKYLGLGLHIF